MSFWRTVIIILLATSSIGCDETQQASTINDLEKPIPATAAEVQSTGPRRQITDSIGARYQLVPAGGFMMGIETGPGPVHEVRISKDFYLGLTEVTQGQWETVMGTRPWIDEDGEPKTCVKVGVNYPAVYVSWKDAVAFCERLSEKEGVKYRLPTEAEWEYACRAGTRTAYSFGDDASELGKYVESSESKTAHEVGQKLPNPWGLYDVHGNVSEWCGDWYASDYYGKSPRLDPQGPSCPQSVRVHRGGYWHSPPRYCRSGCRGGDLPSYRNSHLGFRVLRSSVQPSADP